jgi:DNA helicase-2/ATP-dependent DNA helicase PcrA
MMRSSGVYDYDDLLSLAYKLLTEFPQVAEFYRRLYGYICLDEAQDLNEGQYAVIQALCGPAFRNILLVGDPKQSIYGFNKSSPELMERFAAEFDARRFDLTANFRSSQAVVGAAQALDPAYKVFGSLPIAGELGVIVGSDEADEARQIVAKLKSLSSGGHPALESGLRLDRCAILGRTRYALLATESALREEGLPYYRLLSSAFENESELVGDFMLGLRLASNPRDGLHLRELAERWGGDRMSADELVGSDDVVTLLSSRCSNDRCAPVVGAIRELTTQARLDLPKALAHLTSYADTLPDTERQTVYNDVQVLVDEWDRYLRSGNPASRSIPGFLSSMALGTTRQPGNEGVGLLTVHAAKGLEFDVVFVVGLADGIFPDYRASKSQKAAAEERRNAFVAVTRATRLLYLSFPKTRTMPWGDVWQSKPSPFLEEIVKKASG